MYAPLLALAKHLNPSQVPVMEITKTTGTAVLKQAHRSGSTQQQAPLFIICLFILKKMNIKNFLRPSKE
jgi:hypothetical protein